MDMVWYGMMADEQAGRQTAIISLVVGWLVGWL